jgi:neutral ceramidase
MRRFNFLICLLPLIFIASWSCTKVASDDLNQNKAPGWKAGVAKVNITPEESMWMAGYGSRDHTSEGGMVNHRKDIILTVM